MSKEFATLKVNAVGIFVVLISIFRGKGVTSEKAESLVGLRLSLFQSAFAKNGIVFVISVCLSAWNNSAFSGRMCNFVLSFVLKSVEQVQICL